MSTSDGERIAPVTYLFGSAPAEPAVVTTTDHSPSESPPKKAPRVSFRDDAADEADSRKKPRGSFDPINNVSMHALARRGMSSREMRDYLLGREFEQTDVDEEVARLEGVGLLDDEALAETLVRTLRDRKGLGRSALTAELRRRNVDPLAIDGALESSGDDELLRATELAVKRAPQLRSLDSVTAKRRLGAFLMRKGYSGSVVTAAVATALEPSGPVFR